MSAARPVGIFDSGLGGLSVAREIRGRLPSEPLLYFADTAYCPYGGRPLEEIRARSVAAAEELLRRGAKVIVVACNTASGAALEALRERFDTPIVGLEPAVKPAAEATRSRQVGVLATEATLRTERFERLLRDHADDVRVHALPGPGLVELVEAGKLTGEEVSATLEPLLRPLLDAGVDHLVLGCTHYPFLREAIAELAGGSVVVVDSGEAVARQLERVLAGNGLRGEGEGGALRLLTTADPEPVRQVAQRLWAGPLEVVGVRV